MTRPDEFDAFYTEARGPMLLETFALTGDLNASRSAVRDAFAATWHHWRKATRSGDPIGWLRPHAWSRAQRHHQTHIWRKDAALSTEVTDTLSSLAELSTPQRKALLLRHLTRLSDEEASRIVGLPIERTRQERDAGTAAFASALGIVPAEIGSRFELLGSVTDTVRWPSETAVRRAGAARRRSHTVLGTVAAAAGLVIAGSLVTVATGDRSVLDHAPSSQDTSLTQSPAAPTLLDEADLLQVNQVRALAPALTWQETLTTDNSGDRPVVAPCQPERFADVSGLDTYVRQFDGSGPKERSAKVLQSVELSRTAAAARKTFKRVQEWYGGCTAPRTQLLSTERVSGVGVDAYQFDLRYWGKKPQLMTATVARTGRLTITTVAETRNLSRVPSHRANAVLLATAVNAQCGSPLASECATVPRLKKTSPPAFGAPGGMLKEVDLPPVSNAVGAWYGTKPKPATQVVSTARCATTTFTGQGVRRASTRTFLFPRMAKEREFGLAQTSAVMTGPKSASFMADLRKRLARCQDSEPGTKVAVLGKKDTKNTALSIWRITVEIGDERTATYLLAAVRDRKRVAQIGFVPTPTMTISNDDFAALAQRALARLPRFRA